MMNAVPQIRREWKYLIDDAEIIILLFEGKKQKRKKWLTSCHKPKQNPKWLKCKGKKRFS